MYTECPNCQAIFRVSDRALQRAQGVVRCGECNTIFNATPGNEETDDNTHNEQHYTEKTVENSPDIPTETPPELPSTFDSGPAQTTLPLDDQPLINEQQEQPPLFSEEDLSDDTLAIDNQSSLKEITLKTNKERNSTKGLVIPTMQPEEFFGDTASSPETYTDTTHDNPLKKVLLILLALCLVITIAMQFIYVKRNDFIKNEGLAPWVTRYCAVLKCDITFPADIKQFKLAKHNIFAHPSVDDALIIQVQIKNEAAFKQRYPTIQISMSDLNGNLVALRRFGPLEYLSSKATEQLPTIAPDKQEDITLQVKDPGSNAVSFEFKLL